MSDDWQVRKDIDRLMSFLDDDSINMTLSSLVSRIDELEQSKTDINKVYPVGAVYISVTNDNPSELFGGTWVKIEDKFLLASSNNYQLGSIGGEAEHTLTINEMPSHTHNYRTAPHTFAERDGSQDQVISEPSSSANFVTKTTNPNGSGEAHNNMPPYLAVNVWKRTA